MKKIRIMALALIAAVALTGAGYAAWSTKITYNNTMRTAAWNVFIEKDAADSLEAGDTVQNFKSNYTEAGKTVELNKFDDESAADLSGAVKTNGQSFVYTMAPSITKTVENADTVNFKFYNMHPGTKALTRFEVRNLGTIPARIADVRVIINEGKALSSDQQALVDAMLVSGKFWDHIGSNPSTLIGEIKANTKLSGLESELERILVGNYQLKEQHNINVSKLDGSEMEVDNGLEFSIPANTLNVSGKNVGMLTSIPVKIEFDFVQYNQVQ